MKLLSMLGQSLGAFIAGVRGSANGLAPTDSNNKLPAAYLPASVLTTDGNGKISGAALPASVVQTDGNGKIPVSLLDLGASASLWNFVGGVDGGVDAASAFDLDTLAQRDAGDAYTVTTAGWFVQGAGDAFELLAGQAVAFTAGGAVIKLGNSDIGSAADFSAALSESYLAAVV